MGFWLQLKVILWKNYVIRKRSKLRCVVELVWPLFLFLILMWVRTRGLRTDIPECHLTEKAMPSVGVLPFIQSLLCTFNNSCYQTIDEAQVHHGDISSDGIVSLIGNLSELFNITSINSIGSINRALADVNDLAGLLRRVSRDRAPVEGKMYIGEILTSAELYNSLLVNNISISGKAYDSLLGSTINLDQLKPNHLTLFLQSPKKLICDKQVMHEISDIDDETLNEFCLLDEEEIIKLKTIIKDDLNTSNILSQITTFIENNLGRSLSWKDWQELISVYTRISKSIQGLQSYSKFLDNVSKMGENYRSVQQSMQDKNASKFEVAIELISNVMCGNRTVQLPAQLTSRRRRFQNLQDKLSEKSRVRYSYDNSTTKYCNDLFETIENNVGLSMIWKIFKPFIRGKILYTPVTPATERIMERVNGSIAKLSDAFQGFITLWSVPSTTIDDDSLLNNTDDLRFIRDILSSEIGNRLLNNTITRAFLGSDYEDKLMKIETSFGRFLEDTNTEARKDALNNIRNFQINITDIYQCIDFDKVKGYDNQTQAEIDGMDLVVQNKLWALIEFIDPGPDELNKLVVYKLRMNTDRVDDTQYIMDLFLNNGNRINPTVDLKYITYGFAYLQDMIDHSIMTEHTNRTDLPGIILQQYPFPCYVDDQFIEAIQRTLPMFMVLAWLYSCSMTVKSIVYEKEQRLKETMRVMGLGNGIHWLGWFIDSIIPMFITCILLSLILVYGNILMRADVTIIFVYLLAYALSTISLCFLLSTFFSRANLAAACAGIIFFVLYLPYAFMVTWFSYLTTLQKTLMSLCSNVAFGLGTAYLANYEQRGTGLHWEDVNKSPLFDDDFNLLYVILMLLFDAVLYGVLTWYIETVFPGQYGVPKPWYFLFTWSYWTGKESKSVFIEPKTNNNENKEHFEDEPTGLKHGVTISNLSKVYSNGKIAVNDISLKFYEGHITSFLGHNGAGKTTTISILTGLYSPSQGTANINGFDIRTNMDQIRNSLGMCPQHNVLFDKLTVEEHLWFYGKLRGGTTKTEEMIREEADQVLNDLGLPHKKESMATALSGGMQRKLSIAVAFIGGAKTVILDEPTSGVDPYSRRSIWELLIKYKTGRTVILTTHYMDEADLLSDRIAIIANGELQCCGSSVFLKSHYGSGYQITLEMASYNQLSPDEIAGNTNEIADPRVADLNAYIKRIMPSAEFVGQIGSEVTFKLPSRQDFSSFTQLCDSLDKDMKSLEVMSYGISDTSLEEIFLNVAEQNDPAFNNSNASFFSLWDRFSNLFNSKQRLPKEKIVDESSEEPVKKPEKEIVVHMNGTSVKYTNVPVGDHIEEPVDGKLKIYWRQFAALYIKRFHHSRRNYKALFAEIIVPALFVCLALAVTTIFPTLTQRPPLNLEPWAYSKPRYMFYSNDAVGDNWTEKYIDGILGPIGIGSLCVDGNRSRECVTPSKQYFIDNIMKANLVIKECSCPGGSLVCPDDIGKSLPDSSKVASGDTIYDMTNQNISKWIINTWPLYSDTRFGGYSLGVQLVVPNFPIENFLLPFKDTNIGSFLPSFDSIQNNVGINETNNNIKVWYNNKGWISSVAYMSAINNVVLRTYVNSSNANQYGIKTINHPMNYTENQLSLELLKQSGVSLLTAISVIFALSFVPASFTLYLIEERISNSKHLQLVSGVNRLIYWLQAFVWDMGCYLLTAILCILIFLCYDQDAYVSAKNFPGLVLLFILYGWSVIPLMYPFSFLFSVPSSAFVGLSCANMFIGIITTITTFVLAAFDDEELTAIADVVKEVFLIFPHFCLGDGLMKLATNYLTEASFNALGISINTNIFDWDYLGKNLLCMFVLGAIFFMIALAVEFKLFTKIFYRNNEGKIPPLNLDDEEEDVTAERLRVEQGNTAGDLLVINKLIKKYKKSKVPSVNGIALGVKQGECFGLLGLNGAGKTSTFKMLTGAIRVTSGDATIKGHSIVTEIDKVRALLGYCPQFDALDPLLTPREHLDFYAKIRNIPSAEVQKRVDLSIRQFGLGYYSSRLAGTLSGGNKRKLSTAIALIGSPPLVFLDEPTSGMDPKARRFLWSCIQDVVKSGSCVILTSHSMEECQALCTRLTIMVNGKFKCLGTSQHLKNKFGAGYSVVVRCLDNNMSAVKDFVSSKLEGAVLLEAHYNQLRYQMTNCQLSYVFKELEDARTRKLITDYSLSQTTLEEVFIRFANDQIEITKKKKKKFPAILKKCIFCQRGRKSSV